MNTMTKIRSLLLTLIVMLSTFSFVGVAKAAVDKTREHNQTFAVSNSDLLNVDNKYGNITISHWDRNEINIRVVVEARAANDKRVEEILDKVTITLNKRGNVVYAETSLKNVNTRNNERLNIDYFISMPVSQASKLAQKYGNINMPEKNDGKTDIEIKYGNIKAGSFTKDLTLDCEYGNVDLGNLVNATMELSYSGKTRFGNAESVTIESKYSQIEAKDIKQIRMKDSYGGLKAGKVGTANLEFKYGKINIEAIEESLVATKLDYSNLEVSNLSANFSRFNATTKYGGITIGISSNAQFNVRVDDVKYGNYSITGFRDQTQKNDNSYTSTVNGGNSNRVIHIEDAKYSNIRIKSL